MDIVFVGALIAMEADVSPLNRPDRADLVDGSIGEGSFFHETFGYYAQGVGPETATLPDGWQARLTSVKNENTRGVEGLCLEVHDLALSKYVAGRDKDLVFTRELARHGLSSKKTLLDRLKKMPVDAARRKLIAARVARDFNSLKTKRPAD